MISFYNKSYKRVGASNFLDSSSDEEEENRRTSSVQTKKSFLFDSSPILVPTTTSSATSTLPSSSSTSQIMIQSLKHERSKKTKFNRRASDLDISVHPASPEGHSTTNESSFASSFSTSKKTLECMSPPNDTDKEFGDFHVDTEKGN